MKKEHAPSWQNLPFLIYVLPSLHMAKIRPTTSTTKKHFGLEVEFHLAWAKGLVLAN